jgi:hypothetical protein
VSRDDHTLTAHVRYSGGQHTTLTMPVPKPAAEQRRTPAEIVTLIDELLDEHTVGEIVEILNQRGLASGTSQPFHDSIVTHIIRSHQLTTRRQRLRQTGMLTITEMADRLGVCTTTIKQWHRAGLVGGLRYNDKGESLYHPPDPAHPPTPHRPDFRGS